MKHFLFYFKNTNVMGIIKKLKLENPFGKL